MFEEFWAKFCLILCFKVVVVVFQKLFSFDPLLTGSVMPLFWFSARQQTQESQEEKRDLMTVTTVPDQVQTVNHVHWDSISIFFN